MIRLPLGTSVPRGICGVGMGIGIRFLKDWAYYPKAILQDNTKNHSWLEMAELLCRMGIKNHTFMLALLTPNLKHVDPFDPELDDVTIMSILREAKWNPWYMLREIIRVAPKASMDPIPFRANRSVIAMNWLAYNFIDTIVVQPRQTGKTIGLGGLNINLLYNLSRNSTIGFMTKDESLRTETISTFKQMRNLLPPYFYQENNKDVDNTQEFSNHVYNNKLKSFIGQSSEFGATKQGRGFTMPITEWDEPPFTNHIDIMHPAASMAGVAVREEAKRVGAPHFNLYTTTAGDLSVPSGRYCHDFFMKGTSFTEEFYDARDEEELKSILIVNGRRSPLVYCTFSYRQLGYTDEWAAEVIDQNNLSRDQAARDLFNVWTNSGESNPLGEELLSQMRQSLIPPYQVERTKELYLLWWYVEGGRKSPVVSQESLVGGLDTSDGVGRDGISLVVCTVKNLDVVFIQSINESNLYRYACFLVEILVAYPNLTLIIERRSSAQSLIDTLMVMLPERHIDPFKRLFNQIVQDSTTHRQEYANIRKPGGYRSHEALNIYKRYIGLSTTRVTRNDLYGACLTSAVRKAVGRIKCEKLINEFSGLQTDSKGRVDHQSTGNDDTVIAFLLCEWLLTNGVNLSYYGINPLEISMAAYKDEKEKSSHEKISDHLQQQYRDEIDHLFNQLIKTEDIIDQRLIEQRLRVVLPLLQTPDEEYLSIDALLEKSRQARRLNNQIKRITT